MTTCGKVFSWGTGDKDIKAGVSYHEPWNVFDLVDNKDEFIMICAGQTHNVALSSIGEVYTWGD